MDTDYYYFKWIKEERFIANEPWYIALKKRKAGRLLPTNDAVTSPQCDNRFSYKLRSIGREDRSTMDNESWNKILAHSEKQARLRAVQLHLSCVATSAALLTPSRAAAANQ